MTNVSGMFCFLFVIATGKEWQYSTSITFVLSIKVVLKKQKKQR